MANTAPKGSQPPAKDAPASVEKIADTTVDTKTKVEDNTEADVVDVYERAADVATVTLDNGTVVENYS